LPSQQRGSPDGLFFAGKAVAMTGMEFESFSYQWEVKQSILFRSHDMHTSQSIASSPVIFSPHQYSASRFSTRETGTSNHTGPVHSLSHRTIVGIRNSTRRPPGAMRMAARRGREVVSRYRYGQELHLQEASVVLLRSSVEYRFQDDMAMRQSPADPLRCIFGPSFDVNLEESRNNAMRTAVEEANMEAVELLLKVGTDIESRDEWGRTPLMLVVLSRSFSFLRWRLTIDVLLQSGADRKALDNSRNTLMMYAAKSNFPFLIYKLRRAGCITDERNQYGDTALIIAIKNNHLPAVRSLLSPNTEGSTAASPCARNSHGVAPLFVAMAIRIGIGKFSDLMPDGTRNVEKSAAARDNAEIIAALLEAGADVNATDSKGNTLQIYAAVMRDIKLLIMLRDLGADPKLENNNGKSAMTYAGRRLLSRILPNHRSSYHSPR
jgi:ankyrin repeat protein